LSPVNNRYNAISDKAHLFALQFQGETETTLPSLIKQVQGRRGGDHDFVDKAY
jgi:hypothetical protein